MRRRTRWLIGASLSVISLGLAWRLQTLTGQEQLWGWWPLPLLLSLWGIVVAFRQNTSRFDLLGLASAAGLCLGLGFGTYPTWPLQIVGFAAMLSLTDQLTRRQLGLRRQWWYGFHALLLYNIIATWWVANTSFAAGFVANYLNALLMTVPWVLVFLLRRHLPKLWLLGAVSLWLGFEYLHYNWQIAWPWLTMGNALASTPRLVQWFSITGVFGGSLYLTASGALLYRYWSMRGRSLATAQTFPWRLAALVVLPLLLSLGMLLVERLPDGREARLAAIQPNYEPHYAKFSAPQAEQYVRFDSLISSLGPVDLVVLPETSFGGIDQARVGQSRLLRGLSRDSLTMLIGLSTHQRYAEAIDHPALRSRELGNGNTFHFTSHNSALALDEGQAVSIYDKSKLVPGVEFLPYRKAMFLFEPLVESLGGTTAGLGVSDSAKVFRYANGIAAAPLICYESVYGDYVREFTAQGANLLTVPTNDGWWDDTPGHRQHLAFASLRAIENRRYVLQAANSGISALIDARGELLHSTEYDEVATLEVRAELLQGTTFYVRYGDQLGRLGAGASCLLLLGLFARMWGNRLGS